ncbi:hypothetical protein SAMN05421854_117110 [Amycolatopsis rubida]|uniref:Uncharacterized protein n=1 Tax=Amycolatopsis rubida TaxID=112413 RepID=A0A1I6A588_9PSEU|nr:hypothetical protein SAMN05421854_117110 [Amycolatopsis rubida]
MGSWRQDDSFGSGRPELTASVRAGGGDRGRFGNGLRPGFRDARSGLDGFTGFDGPAGGCPAWRSPTCRKWSSQARQSAVLPQPAIAAVAAALTIGISKTSTLGFVISGLRAEYGIDASTASPPAVSGLSGTALGALLCSRPACYPLAMLGFAATGMVRHHAGGGELAPMLSTVLSDRERRRPACRSSRPRPAAWSRPVRRGGWSGSSAGGCCGSSAHRPGRCWPPRQPSSRISEAPRAPAGLSLSTANALPTGSAVAMELCAGLLAPACRRAGPPLSTVVRIAGRTAADGASAPAAATESARRGG